MSDESGHVSRQYAGTTFNYAHRVTVIVDRAGKIVNVFESSAALDPTPAINSCGGP